MRVLSSLGLALLLAACASSGGYQQGAQTETARTRINWSSSTFEMSRTLHLPVHTDTVAVETGWLWSNLPGVYDTLGVPLNMVNAEARALGAVQARVHGRLGDERLSRYLTCGSTMTGEIADQYDIFLTVVTQVAALAEDSTRSVLSTSLRARAEQGAVSYQENECATRGRLEEEIHHRLLLRLATGGTS